MRVSQYAGVDEFREVKEQVSILEWTSMVTEKINMITEVLDELSKLHQRIDYLGLDYCGRCMIDWPCPEAEIFGRYTE